MRGGRSGDNAVLHIVDADASVRDGLCRLALAAGFEAHAYPSVERFLAQLAPAAHGCVLLDSTLLTAGAQMQAAMRSRGIGWPVIMLATSNDDLARHDARSVGARFLLNNPVDAQALFDAIAWVTTEGEP
jgi:FixJ family two-component response regulator